MRKYTTNIREKLMSTEKIASPFYESATLVKSLKSDHVAELYKKKCNTDVTKWFYGTDTIYKYKCDLTGYEFWRPSHIAGNEAFYQTLESTWQNYYKTTRWEYPYAVKHIKDGMRVLEIGCGRGYFLRQIENKTKDSLGLELNKEAIRNKTTQITIIDSPIDTINSSSHGFFDVICCFQVLEHLIDPEVIIEKSISLLKDDGCIIISTPNSKYMPFIEENDAFDLPPHHMGHFSDETYEKIAGKYNLKVTCIRKEPRKASFENVEIKIAKNKSYRALKYLAKKIMNLAFRINKAPGPTILVILKKR